MAIQIKSFDEAKRAKEMDKDAMILANLWGRADKDIFTAAEKLRVEI
ncbi:hypothetical protein [Alteriqipengyuania lutimaris]|nr:hypothetical protein [Alteriqipengyuania lutimaris]